MNPWVGKAVFLAGLVAFVALRVPHESRSKTVKVALSRRNAREGVLIALVALGCFVLPVLYSATSLFAVADHSFEWPQLAGGIVCLAIGLWLFHRSHVDLGTNWSVTLEIRESHRLVTEGVYRRLRHPMYTSFLVYGVAQALLLPNWIAGPAFIVVMVIMILGRLGPEEAMMLEKFGPAYEAYRARTKRVLPGIW